jgi:formylglycine-generating enzyme required for sulfatase activity
MGEVRPASLPAVMRPVPVTLLVLAMVSSALAHAADPRIGLVIGNSDYPAGALVNPANDAKMIAETLTALGFEVVVRRNADQIVMKRSIQDFGARLEKAGPNAVGLFYYAGHGVQLNGRNYLIPTTAHIDREADVEIEAVSADWVIEEMRYARNALNIVILDACRNNPFSRGMRSADRGLATMEAPAGILIAYSTAPGSVAADGSGRNSPYTQALAQAMREVRAPVEQVFKHVRVSVMGTTAGKQVPWESSSLTGDFYFAGPLPSAPVVAAPPPPVIANPTSAPIPTSRPAPAGPMISGVSAAPLLRSLGIASSIEPSASYPQASIRQLIERAPRRVTLGSTPKQINSALVLCQQDASDCQSSWYADEGLRTVTLSPFELDVAPVSVHAFRQFAEGSRFTTQAETEGFAYAVVNGRLQPVSGGSWRNAVKQRPLIDEAPVVGVSFNDAVAYCRSKGARLPSEDEWEYIARGPERHVFAWGDNVTKATAQALSATRPPLVSDGPMEGIAAAYRGMTGTVWQWVDTTVGGRKVLKGGSWLETNRANKRAASRRYELPGRADEDSGFRCARSVPLWPDAEYWMSQVKP